MQILYLTNTTLENQIFFGKRYVFRIFTSYLGNKISFIKEIGAKNFGGTGAQNIFKASG